MKDTTKLALEASLKNMIKKKSFSRITIQDITDDCGISRMAFYYHFKDKYDLVEWIFESEFIAQIKDIDPTDQWTFLRTLCDYFYQERTFYIRALEVRGQNAFRDYFREFFYHSVEPFLALEKEPGLQDEVAVFYSHFISDAVLLAIIRWLTEGARLSPEDFVRLMRESSELLVRHVREQYIDPTKK